MKNWKKWLVLLLALATVFALAACNKEEPEETEPTLNKGDANCQHVFTEWVVEKERSCTKKGLKTRKCETCGREEEEVLLAYGHTYYGDECSECGKAAKDCEHPETETVLMSEATCTESGESREVCKICKGVVRYNHISALWHPSTTEVVVKEVTCTENGEIHYICDLCGEVADYDYIWATWHGDVEYVVVSEPTCTENGLKQEICKVCNQVVDEYTLWSNGHSYEYIDAKYPTCTEIGWSSYRHCTVCDYLYNYTERPATGHSYQYGTCTDCATEDPSFHVYTAVGIIRNDLNVAQTEENVYAGALGNVFKDTTGHIVDKTTVNSWTLTVAEGGRFYIWLDDIFSGYYLKLYVYNALGERVANDSSIYNKDGLAMDLAVGVYTVEVTYGSGLTTYNMNIGMAKSAANISEYTMVQDEMEFARQKNVYTFTAKYNGVYYFGLNELQNNAYMHLSLYNRLNERVAYDTSVKNGEGIKVELTAGETYTLYIENTNSYITPYILNVGHQKQVVSVNGYNYINDQISFYKQTNAYTFVAVSNDYRIDITGMTSDMRLDVYVYNYLNERVSYTTYCANEGGLTFHDLVAGQTYTIQIVQNTGYGSYTLRVLSPKYGSAVNANTGVSDKIEHYGQVNYYEVTASESGQLSVKLYVDNYVSVRYVHVSIYDANGNLITYDDYFYGGDTLVINATPGEVYIIRMVAYNGTMDYRVEFH